MWVKRSQWVEESKEISDLLAGEKSKRDMQQKAKKVLMHDKSWT